MSEYLTIVCERETPDTCWSATSPHLPGFVVTGRTLAELLTLVADDVPLYLGQDSVPRPVDPFDGFDTDEADDLTADDG